MDATPVVRGYQSNTAFETLRIRLHNHLTALILDPAVTCILH